MSVTLSDIAVRTNLNKGTVSRILNGKGVTYPAETRQRVLDTAAAMGYQPNMLARALQTGRTNTVALWLNTRTFYSPYFGVLQHHLQLIAREHHYRLLTELDPLSLCAENEINKANPSSWPVDGVICSYMMPIEIDTLRAAIKRDSPMVCLQERILDNTLDEFSHTDYVLIDTGAGARQAVEHLLSAGCSRIAYVSEPHAFDKDVRAHSYRDLMESAGKKLEFVATSGGTRRCALDAMKAHIEQFGCPDGVFCPSDELAIGCYLAMQTKGIRVPQDALLVGFDGLESAELFPCPISSVVVPLEEMCNIAWTMLQERISNPNCTVQQRLLTPRLEVRESSQC